MYGLDAALVEIRLTVIFPIKWVATERRLEVAGADVLRLVQFSALEMVALESHHVVKADFAVGFDIKRHAVA